MRSGFFKFALLRDAIVRLHDFIQQNMESILQAWEDFARCVDTSLPIMDAKRLRNHAHHFLLTVAKDMRANQDEEQQIAKSHGLCPHSDHATPAETHAITRLVAGFSLDQLVSEYRALRSSVLRLWLNHDSSDQNHNVQDMIRFNEAIDQALAESVTTYGHAVETTRKTVLGVLGHDLRSPLGAVLMASDLIRENETLPKREQVLVEQIGKSARRANQMVNDLLDLARCNLGKGIPVFPEKTDLSKAFQLVISEMQVAHPQALIVYSLGDSVEGQFDPSRMDQVFSNLIGNAICHGAKEHPIHVALSSNGESVIFEIQNQGEVIPAEAMPYLFNPEGRYSSYAAGEKGSSAGLGLGLYIAAEIVKGHGGKIEVRSDFTAGTVFKVILPQNGMINTGT
ncbi:Signal transduction histidine kinase [Pseudomonas sp. NFACC25]|jgi:signal transduction histidine kinase|uniref:sensor histidine kinase n=1 Tax=Pseudomonas sp. NFACC25 TaxID=1566188 RepID=UPI000876C19C|nr:Signal transduction histidine kinase [Pseudomonas sp. NFACC25]